VNLGTLDYDIADVILINFGEELRERDVLRGGALTGILEKREQRQQQQNDNDPEGKIAQVRVHRSSFVAARNRGLIPLWVATRVHPGSVGYNLGATEGAAKGTGMDYLTHLRAFPVQIMAVLTGFSHGG
jgi:hypothetical protein